jgi:hypothetical protein
LSESMTEAEAAICITTKFGEILWSSAGPAPN